MCITIRGVGCSLIAMGHHFLDSICAKNMKLLTIYVRMSACNKDYWGGIMPALNVSLPGQLKNWVAKQVEAGRYSSASDYLRDLIREDLRNQ